MLAQILVGTVFILILAKVLYDTRRHRRNAPSPPAIDPGVVEISHACRNWRPPAELASAPPRPARVQAKTLAELIFFGLIFGSIFYFMCDLSLSIAGPARNVVALSPAVVIGLLMFVVTRSSLRLLARGQVTCGVLTHVFAPLAGVPLEGKYGRARSAGAVVYFAFLDQDRNVLHARGNLPAGAEPGQAVTVVYDPSHPKRNTLYPLDGFEVRL